MKANKQELVKTTSSDLQRKQLVNEYETYLPKKLEKILQGVNCIDQVIILIKEQKTDTIGALIRATNEDQVSSLLSLHLVNLNILLGLNKPLNEIQIEYISKELVSRYKALSMADVYLILKRAVSGEYGEFYESITPAKVLRWFSNYLEERCIAFEETSQNEGKQFKNSYMGDGTRASVKVKQKDHEFKKFKLEYEMNEQKKHNRKSTSSQKNSG